MTCSKQLPAIIRRPGPPLKDRFWGPRSRAQEPGVQSFAYQQWELTCIVSFPAALGADISEWRTNGVLYRPGVGCIYGVEGIPQSGIKPVATLRFPPAPGRHWLTGTVACASWAWLAATGPLMTASPEERQMCVTFAGVGGMFPLWQFVPPVLCTAGWGACGVTRRESGVLEGTPNLGFGLVDVPLQYLPTGLIF